MLIHVDGCLEKVVQTFHFAVILLTQHLFFNITETNCSLFASHIQYYTVLRYTILIHWNL